MYGEHGNIDESRYFADSERESRDNTITTTETAAIIRTEASILRAEYYHRRRKRMAIDV